MRGKGKWGIRPQRQACGLFGIGRGENMENRPKHLLGWRHSWHNQKRLKTGLLLKKDGKAYGGGGPFDWRAKSCFVCIFARILLSNNIVPN